MNLDFFFCSAPQSVEREKLAAAMLSFWEGLGIKPRILTPRVCGCSDYDFQKVRRAAAEVLSRTIYYWLVDDDCELITTSELGIAAMKSHADFGIISAFPANATIHRWTPEVYEPYEDMSVSEHVSVGGIRLIRRGCMAKCWPDQTNRGYDREHCEALRLSGYRVGYSQHMRMIHHGEGSSDLYPTTSLTQKTDIPHIAT